MSNTEPTPVNYDAGLVEAFRRIHFLDHAFPAPVDAEDAEDAGLSRAQGFELIVVAAGVSPDVSARHRHEGLMLSIDDYNAYLEGGVKALTFDQSFIAHVAERIHQARLMRAPDN